MHESLCTICVGLAPIHLAYYCDNIEEYIAEVDFVF